MLFTAPWRLTHPETEGGEGKGDGRENEGDLKERKTDGVAEQQWRMKLRQNVERERKRESEKEREREWERENPSKSKVIIPYLSKVTIVIICQPFEPSLF